MIFFSLYHIIISLNNLFIFFDCNYMYGNSDRCLCGCRLPSIRSLTELIRIRIRRQVLRKNWFCAIALSTFVGFTFYQYNWEQLHDHMERAFSRPKQYAGRNGTGKYCRYSKMDIHNILRFDHLWVRLYFLWCVYSRLSIS